MSDPEHQIRVFLDRFNEEIQLLVQALRTELQRETRPTFELVGNSAQSFNIGYGFTTTAWDCYCAIIVYQKHINISFPSGVLLSDPDALLHGVGSRVRHLKVKALADVQGPAVRRLLHEARTKALFLVKDHDKGNGGEVTTVIKTRKRK